MEQLLPLSVNKILAGRDPNAPATTLAALNAGGLLVNYIGHGSIQTWASDSGELLDADAAASLTNGAKTPFVVDMTCLNGDFAFGLTSLAEALLKAPNGGAVGVWASSGMTNSAPQNEMNKAFVRAVFGSPITVGEAPLRRRPQ